MDWFGASVKSIDGCSYVNAFDICDSSSGTDELGGRGSDLLSSGEEE